MSDCKDAVVNRALDEALAATFPAGDPPALIQPEGDVREARGCCCSPSTEDRTVAPNNLGESCCAGDR